jgi:uncharacterized protein (TIGR02118 family)
MIKLVFCVRRLPSLSREEFQRYWREEHAALMKKHAASLGLRRYVQSHTIEDPRFTVVAESRGSAGLEFDGITEVWWDSKDALLASLATKAARAAGRELLADEARFIDMPNSPIFVTEEIEVVG